MSIRGRGRSRKARERGFDEATRGISFRWPCSGDGGEDGDGLAMHLLCIYTWYGESGNNKHSYAVVVHICLLYLLSREAAKPSAHAGDRKPEWILCSATMGQWETKNDISRSEADFPQVALRALSYCSAPMRSTGQKEDKLFNLRIQRLLFRLTLENHNSLFD